MSNFAATYQSQRQCENRERGREGRAHLWDVDGAVNATGSLKNQQPGLVFELVPRLVEEIVVGQHRIALSERRNA